MSKKNILVVEDEGLVANDIKRTLESVGYNVTNTVSTGEKALKEIEENLPDLILMDIVLEGGIDGIETARKVLDKYDIPIIYLTAYGDSETVRKAKDTKPLGYIVKPFQKEGLYSSIEVALYTHELKSKMMESERKYRNLVETVHGGMALVDEEENFIYVNEGMCNILGYTKEELLEMNVKEIVRREHLDTIIDTTRVKVENGKFTEYEVEMLRKNGKNIYVSVSSSPFLDYEDNYLYTVALFLDITEQVKTEIEIGRILDVENVLANILSKSLDISDIDDIINSLMADIGQLCQLSRVQLYLLSEDGEELTLSYEWCDADVTRQIDKIKTIPPHLFSWIMRRIFSNDIIKVSSLADIPEKAEMEKEFFKKQNIKSILALPVNTKSKVIGFLAFNDTEDERDWNDEDIALLLFSVRVLGTVFERQNIMNSLIKSEMRYHSLVDELDDFIYVVDKDLNIVLVNRKFNELLTEIGFDDDPIGKDISTIFPSMPDEVISDYERLFETGNRMITEDLRNIGGKSMWLEIRKIPASNESGEVFQIITVMRDITKYRDK